MNYCAIDLGTHDCKLAALDQMGNPKALMTDLGEPALRSAVFFEDGVAILVGSEAENAGLLEPTRVVVNWKRHMGSDVVLYEDKQGKKYLAKDIAEIFLRRLRDICENGTGSVLESVAVSCPANYTTRQREETIAAAAAVGLKVVKLFQEPTCGAFGNRVQERGNGKRLVLDLGGGTFDVSLIESSCAFGKRA